MSEAPSSSDMPGRDDLIGRQIGQYEILRELGRGGMATVYLARQRNMNRQVAIKVLPREFLHDPQFINRFKREVQLIAELEHPHILPVYDFGEHDKIPFIVMRYLAGGSLLDLLDQGLPPLEELEQPSMQVCAALDFAHAEGIIHRDLKPSNIMLDERGNAYLSDFGIAQIMQDAGRLTGSAVIGTPAYMSPEQAEGRPLDARADVYAMGVVLFELVTGREPYQADTPMAMLLKQITEPMPSPLAYRPDLPRGIEEVILRATLKDPSGRYPAAGDFAVAYSRAMQSADAGRRIGDRPGRAPAGAEYAPPTDRVPGAAADEFPTVVGDEASSVPAMTPQPFDSDAVREAAAETTPKPRPAVAPEGGRRGLWLGLAALAVIVVAVALVLASGILNPAPTPTLESVVIGPATPFVGANTYRGPSNLYQISIPNNWQREEITTDRGLGALWFAVDGSAFAAVRLYDDNGNTVTFSQRWTSYETDMYHDDRLFSPLSREAQPDGSMRVSFRIPQPDVLYDRFGQGQLDVFYMDRAPYFVVFEVFTRDGIDEAALLPVLQDVLDSVYVDTAVDWQAPS